MVCQHYKKGAMRVVQCPIMRRRTLAIEPLKMVPRNKNQRRFPMMFIEPLMGRIKF